MLWCETGDIVWLWEASWRVPRLAVADDNGGSEWHYECGAKVGADGERYPTHYSAPIAPQPPRG